MTRRSGFICEWILPVIACILLTHLFRTHFAEARYIPTGSMEPTIHSHDVVLIDKFNHKEIDCGDIVIFYTPKLYAGKKPIIKRVIALPGETLQIINGTIFINGKALFESYIKEQIAYDFGPVVIPECAYFVMGDNRDISFDSRYIGTIDATQIRGKFLTRIPLSTLIDYIREKLL